jgi:GH15 family glucan-1,4-alpha-glucosidase
MPSSLHGDGSTRHDMPIEEHGLIGDLQTTALVATDGTIDFYCCPRHDSPSMFASLLDAKRGGYFRITPTAARFTARQLYLPGTAILLTRFMAPEGVGELVDFMPVLNGAPTDRHCIVRVLRVVRGHMGFLVECQPRFDYGRARHKTELFRDGVAFHADDGTEVAVHIARRPHVSPEEQVRGQVDGDGVRATIELDSGEVGGLMLESAPLTPPRELAPGELLEVFAETRDFWRHWVGRSRYTGRWRESVERSAMTLKLLTYQPTGAPIAAPTFGLPEQPGGERNWDYRYTWVRDGSFSVHSLLDLGYVDEARAFLRWLGDRVRDASEDGGESPLKIMYRVDGSSDLVEESLDHLSGWRESRPVRIGNGAAGQLQLDIYGEAFDALSAGAAQGLEMSYDAWGKVSRLLGWLCDNWDREDEGIWETRGGRQHFTYGRVMSWVAFDRGIRFAQSTSRPADLEAWTKARNAIYEQVMTRGWNEERKAFVQHYATNVLDASNLTMPLVGFVSPHDPRWQSTLDAMDAELVSDSLVYRYDPSASPDGLLGDEGTFSICTFWFVDALARSGRLDEARLTFEKMLTYANHLGLYSEEIGPTGEQLGNFPQAFSHLALIKAATTLDRELSAGHRE